MSRIRIPEIEVLGPPYGKSTTSIITLRDVLYVDMLRNCAKPLQCFPAVPVVGLYDRGVANFIPL